MSGSLFEPPTRDGDLLPVQGYQVDEETMRALRRVCHAIARLADTVTYLLWLVTAVTVLLLVMVAVAVANNTLPG